MPTYRARAGARAEELSKNYLAAKSYEILTTNFRCPWGEVDIIAQEGSCLVFVEVCSRRSSSEYGSPEESLSKRKRERLVATAETYIQVCSTPPEDWRIYLVAVDMDDLGKVSRMEHIQNAIELA